MLVKTNIKMALDSIINAKWRSFLTMLGVIIGVLGVITVISIGEGIRRQVTGQINQFGADLITIKPGRTVNRDRNGNVTSINPLVALGGNSLSEIDLAAIRSSSLVGQVVPFSLIPGSPKLEDRTFSEGFVIASTEAIPEILHQKVQNGTFFKIEERNKPVAIIGRRVADTLFEQNVPIGHSFTIRNKTFVVQGVMEDFVNSPLVPGMDYNSAIFIPYEVGKEINNNQVQLYQILAQPKEPNNVDATVTSIKETLLKVHDSDDDFTILSQTDNLALTDSILMILTRLVAGIAAVSLIVGGVGIMNIMLVSVSERTHEIGVRKAIGATNRQIAMQFLLESAVISTVGGLIAVLLAFVVNYFIRVYSSLTPVISLAIVLASVSLAIIIGIIFGVAPAIRAARKDPIESLRQI